MEVDPVAWVVHRHVVDPCLDELDLDTTRTGLGRRSILPVDMLTLDTQALEQLALETMTLLAATDEVASAG